MFDKLRKLARIVLSRALPPGDLQSCGFLGGAD